MERFADEVPGTAGMFKIPLKEFNHMDYIWAVNSYDLLYKVVIKTFQNY